MSNDPFTPNFYENWSILTLEQKLGTLRFLCQFSSPDGPLISSIYGRQIIDFLDQIQTRLLPNPQSPLNLPVGPRKMPGSSDGDVCVAFSEQLESFETGQILDQDDIADLKMIATLFRQLAARHLNDHGQFQPHL